MGVEQNYLMMGEFNSGNHYTVDKNSLEEME